jgi:putative transposase
LYGDPFKIDKKTGDTKRRSGFEIQCVDLVKLKIERPWYGTIYSIVLQQMLKQLDTAYKNFFEKGRGYPRFKRRAEYKSFTYTQNVKFEGSTVYLPGIGWMGYHNSRPFPDGFQVKSVTVRKKTSGWYISVRLEDKLVPLPQPAIELKGNLRLIGIDLGIRILASVSDGRAIENPKFRFNKRTDRIHRIRARRVTKKQKGSSNRKKATHQLSVLDEVIARRREDYQWKEAKSLVDSADIIVFEDLNVAGIVRRCKPKLVDGKHVANGQAAKSGLNRLILDAGWSDFKAKVISLSSQAGVTVIEIDPKYSSQECSCCGYISPTNRDREKFLCEACGHLDDADQDASKVIAARGAKILGLNLDAVLGDTQKQGKSTPTEISPALVGEPGNQQLQTRKVEYIQLSLFEGMLGENGC